MSCVDCNRKRGGYVCYKCNGEYCKTCAEERQGVCDCMITIYKREYKKSSDNLKSDNSVEEQDFVEK